jgi:hypothetical protein
MKKIVFVSVFVILNKNTLFLGFLLSYPSSNIKLKDVIRVDKISKNFNEI